MIIDLLGFISLGITFIVTTKISLSSHETGIKTLTKLIKDNHKEYGQKFDKLETRVTSLEEKNENREHFDYVIKDVMNNCDSAIQIQRIKAIEKINKQKSLKFNAGK